MSRMDHRLRDAGAHWHGSAMDKTLMGGGHWHLLSDLKTVLKEGEHAHDITELQPSPAGVRVMSKTDGAHVHEMTLSDGTKIQTENPDGAHAHEVLPDGDARDSGQHVHTVKMPDGTELTTLTPEQIRVEVSKGSIAEVPGKSTDGLFKGLLDKKK